jgi:hypothetical protein
MGPLERRPPVTLTGQLVRKDNPATHIKAVIDTVPGLALLSDVTLLESGILELDYAGETKIDWNGQRSVHGPQGRIFVDENDAFVAETQVAVLAEDGSLHTPPLPLACQVKPACSMMDALQQAVAGRRVRMQEWEDDVFLRFTPSTGFALARFSDPNYVDPYSPARLDVDAASWTIIEGEEVGHVA